MRSKIAGWGGCCAASVSGPARPANSPCGGRTADMSENSVAREVRRMLKSYAIGSTKVNQGGKRPGGRSPHCVETNASVRIAGCRGQYAAGVDARDPSHSAKQRSFGTDHVDRAGRYCSFDFDSGPSTRFIFDGRVSTRQQEASRVYGSDQVLGLPPLAPGFPAQRDDQDGGDQKNLHAPTFFRISR